MTDPSPSIVAAGYDAVYEAMPRSPTLARIWRQTATDAAFPEAFLHLSFVTTAQLRRMAEALRLRPGGALVDVGCGTGGPALWMARETGARLTGVDFSRVAVARAAERAAATGLSESATFVAGSFAQTGLPDASADAVMSEDALQYAPDKSAAFREIARVLRPGGRLAFTAFEIEPDAVAGLPVIGDDPAADYRPAFKAAGFTVETYEEAPGWPEPMCTAYQALLDAREALIQEMGPLATTALFSELTLTLERRPYRRRVLAVAMRA